MTGNQSDRIDRLIRDALATPTPDEVTDRLHKRTVLFAVSEHHRHRHPVMVRLAVAAAVMITAAGMWCALKVSRPDDAFAQAARQLRTVKTMSYKRTLAVQERKLPLIDFTCWYRYPGLVRTVGMNEAAYDIFDYTTGNGLLVNRNLKVYKTISGYSPSGNIDGWLEAIAHFPERYDADMGEEVLGGITLHKYGIVHAGQRVLLWLTPEGSIHRIESTAVETPEGMEPSLSIITDIVINPDLPDSLFDMSIPEGYTYSEGFAM